MPNSHENEEAYDDDRLDRRLWKTTRDTGLSRRQALQLLSLAAGAASFGSFPRRVFGQTAPAPISKPTP
ncbi:MAG TPA: twin-arginine translocation signal domain-containing protein, partial [Polyangiaceae bacterium]|nr:twin-arginine translocation signal domain-containing protein [Polyangiaceae bacterium]